MLRIDTSYVRIFHEFNGLDENIVVLSCKRFYFTIIIKRTRYFLFVTFRLPLSQQTGILKNKSFFNGLYYNVNFLMFRH